MSNKKLLFAGLLTSILFAGCYKDKGNYDYTDINKITISDSAAATRIYIAQGATLKLTPTINQTISTGSTLNYIWFAYDNASNSSYVVPYDTVGHEASLNYVVSNNFVLGQDYRLILKVTDEGTGISSSIFYNLTISNTFAQGWLLYEDKSGTADLAMILDNNTIFYNVYSDRNKTYPLSKPVSITASPFSVTDDLSTPGKRIYLQTETDAIELNALTMVKKFDVGYLFFAKPTPIKPTFIGWQGYLSGATLYQKMGVAINNGKVHTNLVGGFPGIKKWGEALITPQGDYNYNVAPYIAAGVEYSPTYATIVYDNTGKRFYSVGSTALVGFPAAASTVFDLNNVGLDLIKIDSSNVSGRHNAIMKDAANKIYLLQFKNTASSAADPSITVSKAEINASGLSATSQISASTLTPHIYYSGANKLYKYEVTSDTYTEQASFAANETITKILYKKADATTSLPILVVATWDGTEGKVYKYAVSSVGNLSATYTDRYTGFAKIIDLVYKVP